MNNIPECLGEYLGVFFDSKIHILMQTMDNHV